MKGGRGIGKEGYDVLFYEVVVDVSEFGGEVDTEADDFLARGLEGEGVVVALNLLEGELGSLVELELEDIDILVGLDSHVDTALRGMVFGTGVEATEIT